jgi:uncharacterized protein
MVLWGILIFGAALLAFIAGSTLLGQARPNVSNAWEHQMILPKAIVFAAAAVLWATPAAAIECSKAASADEKAICGSPDLMALDQKLTRLYEVLMKSSDRAQQQEIKNAQYLWLRKIRSCDGDAVCLKSHSSERVFLLAGKPSTAGDGAAPLAPRFQSREGKTWNLVQGLTFAEENEPYQKIWNGSFNNALKAMFGPDGFFNFETDETDEGSQQSYAHITVDVSYLSNRYLFGSNETVHYEAGAARPNWDWNGVALHVPSGKTVEIEELIDDQGVAKLTDICVQKAEVSADFSNEDMSKLEKYVGDLTYWKVTADGLDIVLPRAAVPEVFGCSFAASELLETVKPGLEVWKIQQAPSRGVP